MAFEGEVGTLGGRGRPAELVEDVTPFDGPRIDVRRRIGWLLRTNRMASTDPDHHSLAQFASRLGSLGVVADAPRLSAWENGRATVSTSVMMGYRDLIGLPLGQLRAAAGGLMACSASSAVFDTRVPLDGAALQARLDTAYHAVLGPLASGGDWLAFSELLATADAVLPTEVVEPLLDRLLSETMRAVGMAYATRFGALSWLVAHPHWGAVVVRQARPAVEEPLADRGLDPVALLRRTPETSIAKWLVRVAGRTEDIRRNGGAAVPREVLASFVTAAQERLPEVQDRMYARLVKEALASTYVERRHHASLLLLASPYRSATASAATEVVERCTSPGLRRGAAALLGYVIGPDEQPRLTRWLVGQEPELQRTALLSLAHGPGVDPGVDLARLVAVRPALTGAAAYAAGMSDHPALREWTRQGGAPAPLRRAARWWLATGSAVTDALAVPTATESRAA